jgi:hypothetical protein
MRAKSPSCQSSNSKGPEPTGFWLNPSLSSSRTLLGTTYHASTCLNGPKGYLRLKWTVRSPSVSTVSIMFNSVAFSVSSSTGASKEYLTSSAVTGSPFWNVAFSSTSTVHRVPSSFCSGSPAASSGLMSVPSSLYVYSVSTT